MQVERAVAGVVVMVGLLVPLPVQARAGEGIQCPSILAVDEVPIPPVGWRSGTQRITFKLNAVSILATGRDGQEDEQIPDEQVAGKTVKLVWEVDTLFKAYRVTLRCKYKGTTASLSRSLPDSVTKCWAVFIGSANAGTEEVTEARCK